MPVISKRVAYGIGVVSVIAIAVVGGNIRNDKRADAVERFSVAKVELVMLDTCESAATDNDLKFRRRISVFTGCGCVATQIAEVTHERDFKASAEIIERVIEMGSTAGDEASVAVELPRYQQKYQLSVNQATDLFTNASTAIAYCSTSEAYFSDEERALIRQQEEELERHEEEVLIALQQQAREERRVRASSDFREDEGYTPETRAELQRRERQTDRNERPDHSKLSDSDRREMFGNPPS